ncbi:MAG: hypothetical protein ACLFPH_10785 [Bacteroidales bacterium]
MKTLELLKQHKKEIVNLTLEHLSTALNGDPCNVAFYVEMDDEGSIKVDHYPFLGNQAHPESVFFIIEEHQRPDVEELGYESLEEVDWDAVNYDIYIETKIDDYIMELEWADNN